MATKKPDIWIAEDGTEHDSEAAADAHDQLLAWAADHVRTEYRIKDEARFDARVRVVVKAIQALHEHEESDILAELDETAPTPDEQRQGDEAIGQEGASD